MDYGHGPSAIIMIMSSSSVTTSMAEFDFLVSFLQGLWIAKMPICSILVDHGRIISVTVKQLVTSTLSVRSTVTRHRPMRLSKFFGFRRPVQSFVPCIANNDSH